ncbi:MAG TPA: alpha/beta hydrolase [Flavobacteriaceae bacterium]|nr:alpha/beta hydrolase [Flavobacteriaceae bacterium]
MDNNLLLLHGALGNKNQFLSLEQFLQPHFKVYALNFSGHGGSVFDGEFSMDTFEKDVLRFMKNNSIEKTHIFGYSMGGYVALNLALHFPEKIEKIMTLGTKINWNPEAAAKELKMLDPEKIEEKVPAFAENLKKTHFPSDWKMVVNKTAKMMQGLGEGKSLKTENFKTITAPVLATIGSEDVMVTKEEAKKLANALPQGSFLEIDGFPHPIEQVDTQKLSEIMIRYFLER